MFRELSISEIKEKFQNKELNPIDIAKECISRYEKLDPTYKSWVCFDKDVLLTEAKNSNKKIVDGKPLRSLEGIPIGVKDIFNTADYPTQMGSPLWKGFTPGNDARVVYNLKNAGGVIAGKTVTAEFAVHALNETQNPHDCALTPGTSSSGSAVAVSLGMVPVSIGTQTAGSIVRPASFCGVYGCKPSFGLIPRTASLKTTDSLDTIGFFTAHSEDLKTVFDVCRVHGPNFPISYQALKDMDRQVKPNARPWKVAFVKTHTWEQAPEYAKQALNDFVNRASNFSNIEIFDVELPSDMERCHAVHETIYSKSLSYYFSDEYKKNELVSPVMNHLIEAGLDIAVQDYHDALTNQNKLINIMDQFLQEYDIMISLSTLGEAPLREKEELPDPALMWTLTHLPVVSAPVFTSPDNKPFGLQISARKYNDILLFRFIDYLRSVNLIPQGCHPKPEL
jgi:Asp-tRNA(Asn)/Glu-tRNA(Gln) amidotransferase A subunit family amidase